MADILQRLAAVLEQRKHADPSSSYVARLYAQGTDAILRKIGEEALETILAGKAEDRTGIVHETADLWFHTLILLARHGLAPEDILRELERRFGTSGLEEHAQRRT